MHTWIQSAPHAHHVVSKASVERYVSEVPEVVPEEHRLRRAHVADISVVHRVDERVRAARIERPRIPWKMNTRSNTRGICQK